MVEIKVWYNIKEYVFIFIGGVCFGKKGSTGIIAKI